MLFLSIASFYRQIPIREETSCKDIKMVIKNKWMCTRNVPKMRR